MLAAAVLVTGILACSALPSLQSPVLVVCMNTMKLLGVALGFQPHSSGALGQAPHALLLLWGFGPTCLWALDRHRVPSGCISTPMNFARQTRPLDNSLLSPCGTRFPAIMAFACGQYHSRILGTVLFSGSLSLGMNSSQGARRKAQRKRKQVLAGLSRPCLDDRKLSRGLAAACGGDVTHPLEAHHSQHPTEGLG